MVKRTIPKKITKIVKNYIQDLEQDGLKIERAIVFGSYAKGKQHKWSDIDVCIISKDLGRKKYPMEYLWTMKNTEAIKFMVSPVGFTPKNFVDESSLVSEIKHTGIRLV